jgi:hypothetical protein
MRFGGAGIPETWTAKIPGGSQVKGAGPLKMGGATLKIPTSDGLEKASCGVEPRKRASLQGFESPSPHQISDSSCFCGSFV